MSDFNTDLNDLKKVYLTSKVQVKILKAAEQIPV